jgi:hypothetical protein
MPWFITAICKRTTMESLLAKSPNRDPKYLPPRSRTFGFYNTYSEAYEAVKENYGNMEECVYDYIVMEYIEPGIHPMVHYVQWWEWDIEKNKWIFLSEEDAPKEFVGICNWALG